MKDIHWIGIWFLMTWTLIFMANCDVVDNYKKLGSIQAEVHQIKEASGIYDKEER